MGCRMVHIVRRYMYYSGWQTRMTGQLAVHVSPSLGGSVKKVAM